MPRLSIAEVLIQNPDSRGFKDMVLAETRRIRSQSQYRKMNTDEIYVIVEKRLKQRLRTKRYKEFRKRDPEWRQKEYELIKKSKEKKKEYYRLKKKEWSKQYNQRPEVKERKRQKFKESYWENRELRLAKQKLSRCKSKTYIILAKLLPYVIHTYHSRFQPQS